MSKLVLTVPTVGELNTVAEPKVDVALAAIETWANGNVGTNNIAAENVTEAMLAKAVQEKLGTKIGLTFKEITLSAEVATTEFIYANKTGITATLPAPTANRMIAVFCGGSATSVKVTCSSGKIYGDYTEGATTVTLTTYQHILVIASGEHWFIMAGEPKREQKYAAKKEYSQAEAEAGVETSATRLSYVVFSGNVPSTLEIGGVEVPTTTRAYLIPPGQKWKTTGAPSLSVSVLLL